MADRLFLALRRRVPNGDAIVFASPSVENMDACFTPDPYKGLIVFFVTGGLFVAPNFEFFCVREL